jgi:hypothetical protein
VATFVKAYYKLPAICKTSANLFMLNTFTKPPDNTMQVVAPVVKI